MRDLTHIDLTVQGEHRRTFDQMKREIGYR